MKNFKTFCEEKKYDLAVLWSLNYYYFFFCEVYWLTTFYHSFSYLFNLVESRDESTHSNASNLTTAKFLAQTVL